MQEQELRFQGFRLPLLLFSTEVTAASCSHPRGEHRALPAFQPFVVPSLNQSHGE